MQRISLRAWLAGAAFFAPAAPAQFVGGWGASSYQYSFPDTYAVAESRLALTASDTVLLPGESAQVNAWAHFPADAFAFAAAQFDIAADIPGWTFASGGVIAGPQVQGIEASQRHDPFNGIFADPANPLRVWIGVFTPASYEPALVQIEATPNEFRYYPSDRTISAVEVDAGDGRVSILVNPLSIGGVFFAPRAGTRIIGGAGNDVLLGGAGADYLQLLEFGFIAKENTTVEIKPAQLPSAIRIATGIEEFGGGGGTFVLTFNGQTTGGYQVGAGFAPADDLEVVASNARGQTVRLRLAATNNQGKLLMLDHLPNQFAMAIEQDERARQTRVISRMSFDTPVRITGAEGRAISADTVEVRACQNNLKQLGLGIHSYEVAHSGGMLVCLGDGSVRTVSSGVGR